MKTPHDSHAVRCFAATALMLGNFITGTSILAPAGMFSELTEGLQVSIRDAGLLSTFGGNVLCICLPLAAWLARRMEGHPLFTTTLPGRAPCNPPSTSPPEDSA